ncbi:MAG: rhomboid family intramembrane serine protease [Phenylobacterium sp.]|nr:rhomboid family intramembrane serine protease [Phenylobacterium sp.]
MNAPWPVVALTGAIVGLYFLQTWFPFVVDLLAFSPHDLLRGRFEGLITSQFLHGGWAHALMNAAFVLAFGAPVARFFGPGPGGVVAFFILYLTCGVLAGLGFAAFHWGQYAPMVGASGAASGLMGAAARLIGGQGRVGPMFSQPVTGMGLAWIIINLIMAFTGGAFIPGAGDAGVAWEAHLAGFAAGVLLIGPVGWLAGRR